MSRKARSLDNPARREAKARPVVQGKLVDGPKSVPAGGLGPPSNQAPAVAPLSFDFARIRIFADSSSPQPAGPSGGGAPATGEIRDAAARGIAGAGSTLPFLDRIQASFGHYDVSRVHAHLDGAASDATRVMGAEAFTTGEHVAFARPPSLHTAAHEAAHVLQQRSGVTLPGGVGRAGDEYERAADRVADRVVRGEPAGGEIDQMTGGADRRAGAASPPWTVQRKEGSLYDSKNQRDVALTKEWQELFTSPLWQRFAGSERRWKTLREALQGLGLDRDRRGLNDPRKVELEGKLGMVILYHAELWLDAVKKVTAYVVEKTSPRKLLKLLNRMDYGAFTANDPGKPALEAEVLSFMNRARSASIAEQFVLHNAFFSLIENEDKDEHEGKPTETHKYRRTDRVKAFFENRGRHKNKEAKPVHGLRGQGEELLEPPPARSDGTSPLGPIDFDTIRGSDIQEAEEGAAGNQLMRLIDMPLAATVSGNAADYMYLAELAGLTAAETWDYGMAAMGRMLAAGHHSFHEIAIVLAGAGALTYIDGDYRTVIPDKLKKQTYYQGLVAQYPDLLTEQEEQIDEMIKKGLREDEKASAGEAGSGGR